MPGNPDAGAVSARAARAPPATYIGRVRRWPRERRQRFVALALAATIIGLALVALAPRFAAVLLLAPDPREGTALTPRPQTVPEPTPEEFVRLDTARYRLEPGRAAALRAPGGIAALAIGRDALRAPVEVELVRHASDASDPLGHAVDLRPDGLSFHEPARLALRIPPGFEPRDVQIVVWDRAAREWRPESRQAPSAEGRELVAQIEHFSLRRLRIRPGMAYPRSADRGRATVAFAADPGRGLERYVAGRWEALERSSERYRELMRSGRMRRHALIASGRLRAVASSPRGRVALNDREPTAALDAEHPAAQTGFVLVRRLDARGGAEGEGVIARVVTPGPGRTARRAGIVVALSPAALEALGLVRGVDFGLAGADDDVPWIEVVDERGQRRHHVPVTVEAADRPVAASEQPAPGGEP